MEAETSKKSSATFSEEKSVGELLSTGSVKVVKMKGNFWKSYGFTKNCVNYLLPEEGLYLFERGYIMIECNGNILSLQELYEIITNHVSINCYLAYSKLKSLDYAVFRYSETSNVFCFESDTLEQFCLHNNIENVISYNAYVRYPQWSKKCIGIEAPSAHVLILSGEYVPNGNVLTKLITFSENVPLIIAVISSTGSIMLQELTDATKSLNLVNNFSHFYDGDDDDATVVDNS